ncbi:MAG TPA: methylated-DNA--[protein]-cysteine S-methyltransferase [Anaerolineales bacterium]|jgi:O-6-methylguanine DNA methyltransferase|nr:methylated-DNA--[protein]-cysteine S-methyltransferase [Anaerolineales bacterium]
MKNQRQPSTVVFYAESAFSHLAPLWAAVSERGLWAASYGIAEEEFRAQILDRGRAVPVYAPEKVRNALWQMEEFLAGNRKRFDLKVDWRGMTPFQIAVRKAVMAVPYGQTASYGEIAAAVGRPQAPRAVGGVQSTNPISFVIPCHRIIGSNGSLHGYGGFGGLQTKAWLLELETKNK